jgi:hypothetical protein
MQLYLYDKEALRAADFAGLVPASRGAHCRPLHPRLASLCCPRRAVDLSRADDWQAGADDWHRVREPRPESGRRPIARRRSVPAAGDSRHSISEFSSDNIINYRRIVHDGIAVL